MKDIDHEYTKEIVCPHCGYELGDSWEYPENGTENCGECKKDFDYQRDIDITYVTVKPTKRQVNI